MKKLFVKVLATDPARKFDLNILQDPELKKGRAARRALSKIQKRRSKGANLTEQKKER